MTTIAQRMIVLLGVAVWACGSPDQGSAAIPTVTDGAMGDASLDDVSDATDGFSAETDPDAAPQDGDGGDGGDGGNDGDDTQAGDSSALDVDSIADGVGLAPNGSGQWAFGGDTVTIGWQTGADGLRTFTLQSTHPLKDGVPTDGKRVVAEVAEQPRLHSGNALLDALFALAVTEMNENAVDTLHDGAFASGQTVPCGACFETGEKWTWAWTRDASYATWLGLAALAPQRCRASLLFKTSAPKASVGGGPAQVVQDTGTGGSWPVSTDRVVWALGAQRLIDHLPAAEASAFRVTAHDVLAATLERDRVVIFDPLDGLYRGEQSFLDWREQSYPSWAAGEPADIAGSKTLSTNLLFLAALRSVATWAGAAGDASAAAQWQAQADALGGAIETAFWLPATGRYATMKTTALDPTAIEHADLLSTALAILLDVAPAERGRALLSTWPHSAHGPAVVWPQKKDVPIYHNRAIWPFVTAFELLAARHVGHAPAFDHAVDSLVRGSALNLSNMENMELISGANYAEDGALSGPVVNSRRQLWSVAGWLGMVVHGVFGLEVEGDGVRMRPFVSRRLRDGWLHDSGAIELRGLRWRGATMDVRVELPVTAAASDVWAEDGVLAVKTVELDDASVGAGFVAGAALAGGKGQWRVTLSEAPAAGLELKVLAEATKVAEIVAPLAPTISGIELIGGQLKLGLDGAGETEVTWEIYRDGATVATGWGGGAWTDPNSAAVAKGSPCYSAATRSTKTGLLSHHARPVCWWGPNFARIEELGAWRLGFAIPAGAPSWSTAHGRAHLAGWGGPGQAVEVASWRAAYSGDHFLQLVYGHVEPLSTGLTAVTKRVRVFATPADGPGGAPIAEQVVVLPQLGDVHRWGVSTLARVNVAAGETYRLVIDDDDGVGNMSYLSSATIYTGGSGGGEGVFNRVDLAAVKLLARSDVGGPGPSAALVGFDGKDDVDKLGADQQIVPGVTLAPWERFGLRWDSERLYVAVVAKGFEDPARAFVLYLQTDPAGAAQLSVGMTYAGLTAELPFTPTHAIGMRAQSDLDDGYGPWSGVFARDAAGGWHVERRFEPGIAVWTAVDAHTMAAVIPRSALGGAKQVRVAGHLVHGGAGTEWKDVVPAGHAPWQAQATGYLVVDLGAEVPASGWAAE